ncbi:MAG TPA: AAA family ATPase [Acidimicrobiales bacterium]|nr:AAA family ATPase [Acidimicrobiales bacterium]
MSGTADRRRQRPKQSGDVQRRSGQPLPASPSRRHRARLLERDDYLSELQALFSEDWDHPVGPIVVEGGTGVGKTAFLKAACKVAVDAGWTVLQARGDGLKEREALGVVRQLVRAHGGDSAHDSPDDHAAHGAMAELDQIVRALAGEHGVVIAVDDAQWSDEESSEWLYRFERHGYQRARLILALASRPPGAPLRSVEHILSEPSVRVMALGALTVESVQLLATEYFDAPPEDAFVRACHEETGGHPSLLFALFRELELERLAPSAVAVERVQAVTSAVVARSVLGKLAALEPDAAAVMEAVAVAGGPVELDLVGEVTGMDSVKVSAAADDLTAVELFARGRPLSFLHPFVRRTVYSEIRPASRAELHRGLARGLKARGAPVQQLADHLAAAEPSGDEWVVKQLEEAGGLALRQGASAQAVRYLSRALAEQPLAPRRPEMLLNLARAEASLDSRPALEYLRQSLEHGAEPGQAAHAALEVSRRSPDLAARAELGPMLQQISGLLSDSEVNAKVELLVAAVLISRSPIAAMAAADLLRSIVGPRGNARTPAEREALALFAVIDAGSSTQAQPTEVATVLRRVVLGEEFVSQNPLRCELWARALLALARTGNFEEADLHARQAQAVGRSHDLELADAEFSTTLAMSLALQGSLTDAESEARWALSVAEERPWARRHDAVACLVGTLLDEGRVDEADTVASILDLADLQPSPLEGHNLLEQRGRVRAAQGRWSEALADLISAGRWADECEVDSPVVTVWRGESALALSALGRENEAVHFAAENLELARDHGAPWVVGSALHLLALVGDAGRQRERLEEAVRLLEGSAAQLRLAGALIDLGRVLREEGAAPTISRTALRRGADLALRSGAAPLISKAAGELRLSGARPRRLALSGAEALTSSERRVVELAASGHTNSEIANTLFLAEKTVEGHLLRAYRKLEIRSRRELRAVYPVDGPDGAQGAPSSHLPN